MPKTLKITDAVDENLKLVRDSDGTDTSLSISKDKMKVSGDLDITGGLDVDGDTKISNGHLTVDGAARINLDGGGKTYIVSTGEDVIAIFAGGTRVLSIEEDGGGADDNVDVSGVLNVSEAINMVSGKKLNLDGGGAGGDTHIYEQSADILRIVVGGDIIMHITESGDDGNTTLFHNTSVGFTRLEATFSTTGVIGSGGTDDTDIDFRFCNKYRLEMTGDITTVNLIFPLASGNFTLVCTTNGDHDVTNWKAFESDETAATTTDVMWAGGSVPAFTNNGVDIVSFYWDANEQQAYGVASLAFATP